MASSVLEPSQADLYIRRHLQQPGTVNLSSSLLHLTPTITPPSKPLDITTTNIHSQMQCPLYALPLELFTQILTHTFLGVPDLTKPYSHTSRVLYPSTHHPRQSHPFHHTIHTTLLLTCKRIYIDARSLPISLNQHVFWPRDFREPILPSTLRYKIHTGPYFRHLLPFQRDAVHTVRFNIPEPITVTTRGSPSVINQKIAGAFLKKKFAGLVEGREGCRLKGLRRLVVDCHNPVFWGKDGVRFEGGRGMGKEGNLGGVREGVGWLGEILRAGDAKGLSEVVIVVDFWKGRRGSGVWEWVKEWEWMGMKMIDDGSSGDEGKGEEESSGYELRVLRWIAW